MPSDPFTRIAALLPDDHRERFFAIASRLRNLPEDDELLMLIEAIGFMTLVWNQVPEQIESILTVAHPIDSTGPSSTTASLLGEVRRVIQETVDAPSYQDTRTLFQELRDAQQAIEQSSKRLLSFQPIPNRSSKGKRLIGPLLLLLNVLAIIGLASWFHSRHENRIAAIQTQVPQVASIVKLLAQSPACTISAYQGHDTSMEETIRALVVEGPIKDAFVDEEGRAVVRIDGVSRFLP